MTPRSLSSWKNLLDAAVHIAFCKQGKSLSYKQDRVSIHKLPCCTLSVLRLMVSTEPPIRPPHCSALRISISLNSLLWYIDLLFCLLIAQICFFLLLTFQQRKFGNVICTLCSIPWLLIRMKTTLWSRQACFNLKLDYFTHSPKGYEVKQMTADWHGG